MKLYLAVAVLLLALASLAEAQDSSITDRFNEFGQDVSRISTDLAEKAKATFTEIQDSQFVADSRSWFAKQFDKIKETFGN